MTKRFVVPGQPENTSVEFGAYGFTPEEITEQGIDRSDRPYSSLVYLSTSRSYQSAGGTSGWTTSPCGRHLKAV